MTQWTDLHRPTDIHLDANETVSVSELAPRISVLDKQGNLVRRRDSPSTHRLGGDSRSDL